MDKRQILRDGINEQRRAELRAFFDGAGLKRVSVGTTVLGREIDMYSIGVGRDKILYVGAHHALEAITENVLFSFIYDAGMNKVVRRINGIDKAFLLQRFTFMVIPALNLDGIAIVDGTGRNNILSQRQQRMCGGDFSVWQANARGVDLNHNYDAGFLEYKKTEAREGIYYAPTKYSGEYPESEPECAAVANLVRTCAPRLVLSLHTQGQEVFFHPNTPSVGRLGAKLADSIGYRLSYATGSAKYGGLCDYTGSIGIPSFTLELGLGKNPLPISHAEPIYARISNALFALPTMI